jgi:hypothetical protein
VVRIRVQFFALSELHEKDDWQALLVLVTMPLHVIFDFAVETVFRFAVEEVVFFIIILFFIFNPLCDVIAELEGPKPEPGTPIFFFLQWKLCTPNPRLVSKQRLQSVQVQAVPENGLPFPSRGL